MAAKKRKGALKKRLNQAAARLSGWAKALWHKLGLEELKYLRLRNFLLLIVAGCVNAVGVTMFLAPVNLYDGGISGTSMLL